MKFATSEGLSEKLLNDVTWTKGITKVKTKSFTVPKIIEYGYFKEGLLYSFYEFIDANDINESTDYSISRLALNLSRINIEIDSIKNIKLNKNELEDKAGVRITHVKDNAERYYEIGENFAKESQENLNDLLEILKNYEQMTELGLNHNDFTPKNILLTKKKPTLIDGESASLRSPRYFDLAIMFNRIYTSLCNPEFAKEYLKCFRNSIKKSDLEYFDFSFKTMLSSRTIGSFWDSTRGGADINYCRRLKEEIVKGYLHRT